MLASLMVGCAGNTKSDNSDSADSLRQSSAEQKADTHTISEQTDEALLTTPDLKFFDLKGHVKKCTQIEDEPTLTYLFDEQGNCTEITEPYANVTKIVRDDKGRITRLDKIDALSRGFAIIYEYSPEGTIAKQSCDAMPDGMSHEFHFTYDAKGRVIEQKGWNDGVGDIEYKYKYTQEDAKGNWTEREKSIIPDGEEPVVTIERREIEYY